MEHPFWGNINCDASGCTAGITFAHPFFGAGKVEIVLQNGPDGMIPSEELLLVYADTYVYFLNHIGSHLFVLKQRMFEVFMEYLKKNDDGIQTLEQHNDYIRDLAFIGIGPNDRVELCFYYSLLNAPVHSVIFIADQLYAIYDEPE